MSDGQELPAAVHRKPGRWLRNVLFALLPMLALLGLSELALWALGLGAPVEQLSLSRGFDEQASYLVAHDGPPWGWTTQMNEGQTSEIEIPPKGFFKRVLLFGGSNAELFPTTYLRQQLNLAAPSPGFEVYNLGRRGYGSERERILLQQAMATEPDVVVIYCGHNEFVEGEFNLQLRKLGHPWLAELGTRLRTVNVLSGLLQRAAGGDGSKPEARRERGPEFDDIRPETTRMYYDAFRENLAAMCRTAQAGGARVLLSTVVTNVLVAPAVSHPSPTLTPQQSSEFARLRKECEDSLPLRLTAGLTGHDDGPAVINLHFEDWAEWGPPDPVTPGPPAPVLRELTGELAGGPFWTAPSHWSPPVWSLLSTLQAFHARQLGPDERASLQRAVAAGEAARAIDPHVSRLLFELGIAHALLGDDPAHAVALLDAAACEDCAPTHANDILNGIVRATAAAIPGVELLDTERSFRDGCPDRLAGYEILMDNCHLQPGARKVLMRDFVPEIVRLSRE